MLVVIVIELLIDIWTGRGAAWDLKSLKTGLCHMNFHNWACMSVRQPLHTWYVCLPGVHGIPECDTHTVLYINKLFAKMVCRISCLMPRHSAITVMWEWLIQIFMPALLQTAILGTMYITAAAYGLVWSGIVLKEYGKQVESHHKLLFTGGSLVCLFWVRCNNIHYSMFHVHLAWVLHHIGWGTSYVVLVSLWDYKSF